MRKNNIEWCLSTGQAPLNLRTIIVELSQYVLEALRSDEEFVLYRGEPNQPGSPSVFLLAPASMQPALETLRKIEHEYSLRDELDSAWAVRSLALSEHRGQMTLVLEDPGGETLDRFLPGPMEMARFLRLAVGTAAALSGLHEKELIHKDVKPANVLGNPTTGQARLMGFVIASRLPPGGTARAPGPRPPRVHSRNTRLHGPRTDRANESLDRFAERPLCARGDALQDGHRDSSVHGVRSYGTGALPYRATAGAARRAVERFTEPGFGNRDEIARQDG